nr:hypothetical protein [Mariniblastus sp.]
MFYDLDHNVCISSRKILLAIWIFDTSVANGIRISRKPTWCFFATCLLAIRPADTAAFSWWKSRQIDRFLLIEQPCQDAFIR